MRQVQIPNFNYASIQWIESDNPKYEKRSQETYPYCVDCKKNHSGKAQRHMSTKMLWAIYTTIATGAEMQRL